jgi:error-prone DNA polymerase
MGRRSGPPGPPSRNFGYSLKWLRTSPGARKEKIRHRGGRQPIDEPEGERWPGSPAGRSRSPAPAVDFDGLGSDSPSGYRSPGARKEQLRRRPVRRRPPTGPLPELRAASAFSFLAGASLPEDLAQRAAELEIPAMALLDRNGLYGTPRFHQAAQRAGIKAIVGAEVEIGEIGDCGEIGDRYISRRNVPVPNFPVPNFRQPTLSLLVAKRDGYRNLCRLLTTAARDRPKGEAQTDWPELAAHTGDLWCLTGGAEGLLARALSISGLDGARGLLERLVHAFDGRVAVEIQRHRQRNEEHRNQILVDLAQRLRLPLVATNGVRYAHADDKRLHDILTCIREHVQIDAAGRLLAAHRERHLKSGAEMTELFADLPAALNGARELANRLDFTLTDLGYRFPDYPLPPGETPSSYLRQVVWNAAPGRFRPLTARAQNQLERELAMIQKLDLAGYFLIVWDIVRFCQRRGILAQGRGSAANSAVCYALSITAVDPVKMELLFERFLSEERGEWPDIDIDLPSGDRREEVIQYVYKRYGPHGAAMTANVITYRGRSAAREVAKALGYSPEQVDKLAKRLGSWGYDTSRGDSRSLPQELAAAGFDPERPRMRLFTELWRRIQNLPRHLGQHSGGMVMAAGRLDEVVPLEPAAMEGRVVVQWDKDDCADLGIIKVDLLGLGMLQALEEVIPLIRRHEGVTVDLSHLPPDDERTYRMLRAADTVGVFQVESRAQMASLPRNAPRCFYDLVIQVAIIRPGPIVGGMVNPYFERRQGRQPVTYPHPSLEPILERTLGVLLFQEQILRVAMTAAGFSGGEAEELRRAMGFKRSTERMEALERKLRRGMRARGIRGESQEQIVRAITSFALYGFPESHAASFALIAYASAYLKAHHPTAFLISLLNAWPMGFYHPASLVKDALRHGVETRPIDVNHSHWACTWEDRPIDNPTSAHGRHQGPRLQAGRPRRPQAYVGVRRGSPTEPNAAAGAPGAARLGLRFVKGLRRPAGEAIQREHAKRPFHDADDLVRRCRLRREELETLAAIGALGSLGLSRRQALWQVARATRPTGPLLAEADRNGHQGDVKTLPEMTDYEATLADYAGTGLTTGPHPLTHLRAALARHRVLPTAALPRAANGARVRTGGAVIVRQRPGTAKGLLFLTLEDETGMAQAIVSPDLLERHRETIVDTAGLVVEGVVQKRDGTLSIKADRFWRLTDLVAARSHDFR